MTNKFTKILLVSAAALGFQSVAAQAANVVVVQQEPVEYVRVCDAYGAGYFYIPGTDTCMRISGYVRAQAETGNNIGHGTFSERETYNTLARATLRFSTASETDIGVVRSFIELRSEFQDGVDDETASLRFGYVEFAGLRVGVDESVFKVFADNYGNVLNDDKFPAASTDRTNKIQYTFETDTGFSTTLALEQGDSQHLIEDYAPHVVLGAKIAQGWGSFIVVGAYDSIADEFAVKGRLNVDVNDDFTAWAMVGYKTGYEETAPTVVDYYGQWYGDFAAWGGFSYHLSNVSTANLQLAYESVGNLYVAANIGFKLTPGLTLTPELNFANYDETMGLGKDNSAFGGIVRLQRDF